MERVRVSRSPAPLRKPSAAEIARAEVTSAETLAEAARSAELQPSGADIRSIAKIGGDGFVRDRAGKMTGLDINPATPAGAKRRKAFMDAMAPYVQAESERCQRWNAADRAAHRTVLLDRATGERHEIPHRMAEARAKRDGLVELPVYGRRQREFTVGHVMYREGGFQRYLGNGQWESVFDE